MAVKTKAEILAEITANITDNSNKENTAAKVREVLTDMNDSYVIGSVPVWIKVSKGYKDFAAAALTNDISIYTLPVYGYVHDVKIIPIEAFSGGTVASYTLSVGKSAPFTSLAIATNVFTGNTTLSAAHSALPMVFSKAANTDVRALATSTVGNLTEATSGIVDFYLLVSTLPQ